MRPTSLSLFLCLVCVSSWVPVTFAKSNDGSGDDGVSSPLLNGARRSDNEGFVSGDASAHLGAEQMPQNPELSPSAHGLSGPERYPAQSWSLSHPDSPMERLRLLGTDVPQESSDQIAGPSAPDLRPNWARTRNRRASGDVQATSQERGGPSLSPPDGTLEPHSPQRPDAEPMQESQVATNPISEIFNQFRSTDRNSPPDSYHVGNLRYGHIPNNPIVMPE